MFGRFAVCRQIAHKNSLASFRFSYPTLLLCYYARPMQSHATHKNVHKNIIIQRRFTTDPELKSNLYQVKVYTGDRRGAGTTARIFMTLYGEKGNSGARRLRGPNNKLERGSVVSFLVSSSHLGDLSELKCLRDTLLLSPHLFLLKMIRLIFAHPFNLNPKSYVMDFLGVPRVFFFFFLCVCTYFSRQACDWTRQL